MPAFKERGLRRSRPLIDELRRIAAAHGATPSQVALNWLTRIHGDAVVVIPGALNAEQARENVGALEFTLGAEEVDRLDRVSREVGRRS